jgi:hypothetical protein
MASPTRTRPARAPRAPASRAKKPTERAKKPVGALAPPAPPAQALTDQDRAVLIEAIERAASLRDALEQSWTDFGRWLFARVFGEDTASAIDHREDNPIWTALYALADGTRVRLRHDELDRAVLTAAYDKRLQSDAWRALDYGRKWRLLRLRDEKLLRKGAQHVLATSLSTRETEAYVRAVLSEQNEPAEVRVNVSALTDQLGRITTRMTDRAWARKLDAASRKLTDERREALIGSIESTRDALSTLLARLSKE